MSNSRVWYVTGASQGLGLSLVKRLLNDGYRVAATSRSAAGLQDAAGVADRDRFLPLGVDLTSAVAIRDSIDETIANFGSLDVVVNNAGYGMEGTVEELEEDKMRAIFEINVFATIQVTKSVLPHLRKQRSGHIINIASVAGFVGAPGWSIYSATKAAVIAFSEVLALDVRELGINVTVVGPSGFRTGFLTSHSLVTGESRIPEYQSVARTHARYTAMDGSQNGDPEKAAILFIRLAEDPAPPLRLWLGANAFERADEKIESLSEEIKKWKELSLSADFT
jgi:NAD(P)-dependent dehydrogenase (short-subunit alcohol dehydrogenase family)